MLMSPNPRIFIWKPHFTALQIIGTWMFTYQYLIRNVEDKNPQNREGLTPLQYAGMKNYHCFENFLSEYLKEEAENEKLKKEFP